MSAAAVVRQYVQQAEATATRTGRRDYRIAAGKLLDLAEQLERRAAAERNKKRRQRAQLPLPVEPAQLPLPVERTQGENGQWVAVGRTDDKVTLRRKAGAK